MGRLEEWRGGVKMGILRAIGREPGGGGFDPSPEG